MNDHLSLTCALARSLTPVVVVVPDALDPRNLGEKPLVVLVRQLFRERFSHLPIPNENERIHDALTTDLKSVIYTVIGCIEITKHTGV